MKNLIPIYFLILAFFAGNNLSAEEANSKAAVQTNSASASEPALSTDDTVVLNAGDKLIFQIKEDPSKGAAPVDLPVNARGDLYFPIAVASAEQLHVNVIDKTLAKVREEIKAKLDTDYYINATVDLRLKDQTQRLGKVYLFGAGLPRTTYIQLTPGVPTTILEAVTQAAPNEFVNLKKIKLIRTNRETGKQETRTIDLKDVQKGNKAKDEILRDGDSIEVPERTIVF